MPVWIPPRFLTIDEMFSRVGLEMFPSQWTGHELLAGRIQPPEYWRDQELGRRAKTAERKAHAEAAKRAAVSTSGSPLGRNSSRSTTRLNETPASPSIQEPDWRSETYKREHLEDKQAADRYQNVAKRIIEICWHGEYLIFETDPSGHFSPIVRTIIQSEAFQGMISDPWAANRDRLRFISREDAAVSTAMVDPIGLAEPENRQEHTHYTTSGTDVSTNQQVSINRQLPARPDGVPNSSWESFREAWRLRPCFPEKRGSISEAARAVAKEKGSDEGTVLRNLFRALKALKQEENS